MAEIVILYLILGLVSVTSYISLCLKYGSGFYISTTLALLFGWLPLAVICGLVFLSTFCDDDNEA